MRQSSKVQGTKIAQAAKDLNVTSVTIRRYISEFNIETATDQNGIKVLPSTAMEELTEVRRLKEEGLTNPKVLEHIEAQRDKIAKAPKKAVKAKEEEVEKEKPKAKPRAKAKPKSEAAPKRKVRGKAEEAEDETEEAEEEQEEKTPVAPRRARRTTVKSDKEQTDEESDESSESEEGGEDGDDASGEGRLKHSLTCQTCGKTFEHLNPRLRDCLDCYRTKRKERRRGGDRHKNVIQHPLAQQVVSKMATREQQQQQQSREQQQQQQQAPVREVSKPQPAAHAVGITQPIIGGLKTKVRSYRKAIEETRMITSSLKRRLERPDLPEGDRRWLEQIYAYQLILHQGWRHLSEYRSTTNQQANKDD